MVVAQRDRISRSLADLLDPMRAFEYCERCAERWLRAEGGRVPLASRHARVLAREILRLRAELAP